MYNIIYNNIEHTDLQILLFTTTIRTITGRIKKFFNPTHVLTYKLFENNLYISNEKNTTDEYLLDEYIIIILNNIKYDLIDNNIVELLKSKDMLLIEAGINLLFKSKDFAIKEYANKEVYGPHKQLWHAK